MVPTLEYKDNEDEEESQKSVWWFLENSLKLHKAPVIDSLCVELGSRCPIDVNVGKWVENAVDRRVLDLKIKLVWSADPTSLPTRLYSCESLVTLTLSDKILVDFPSSSCLTSLRLLKLYSVVYKDEDSVLRCLVIDTPALVYLHILDSSGDYCLVNNMPCLEEAYIDSKAYPDDRLLRSLSSVLSLELNHETLVCCKAINFSRLVKLAIHPEELDWSEPLMLLLGNAPKLRDLMVDYDTYEYSESEDAPLSWNQPSSVPKCLMSQLEIFEWRGYGDRVEEEKILTYILANSKCLKSATISLRHDLEEQELIIYELRNIPRISTVSQLLFN
ncbi:putative FBD-associated F-box protein At1g05080 [Eutrema salsugineum]|nr:putative FBD-associated F-box protein At1g05080 [Eutrema salsugineum]